MFGDSSRNMIIGRAAHQLNAQLLRDMRLGGNRALTLQVNAINLFNTVQWASIDTERQLADASARCCRSGRCGRSRSMRGSGSEGA